MNPSPRSLCCCLAAVLAGCSSTPDTAAADIQTSDIQTSDTQTSDIQTSDTPDAIGDVATPDADPAEVSAAEVSAAEVSIPPWPRCPDHPTPDGSLAAKVANFESVVRAQHLPDGLLRSIQVDDSGAFVSGHDLPSTGLWTAMYLASQALRYDVTGSPEALENAAVAVAGLHDLTEVTGRPGLYGRTYQKPGGDYAYVVEEASPSWVPSPAPGYEGWFFNEEVSKDTMDGIVFGYGVALELLGHLDADEAPFLATARADLLEFVRTFTADGLQIISHEGLVTEHGRLFYSAFDDFPGFNALLALSWIRAAIDEGADDLIPLYDDCLLRLGDPPTGSADCPPIDSLDLGSYLDAIEDALGLYIGDCKTSYDNIDMVFQAAWTLLRREHRPEVRDRLLAVLDKGIWEPVDPAVAPAVHRSTHSLYIYMYGGLAQPEPDDAVFAAALEDALCTLHELPADRRDVDVAPGTQEGVCLNRGDKPNAADVIPIAERYYDNYIWRLDPYEISLPHTAVPGFVHTPEDFLLAYWLGRHLGYVSPDE